MASTVVLLASLVVLVSNSESQAPLPYVPPMFVIGGNSTDIKQHPYQVAIWSNAEFRGSGAIVAKGWAITTASIVVGFDAETLAVRARSSLASSGGDMYNVAEVLIHPRFRFSNMTFDVALLRLRRPLMTSPSRDTPLTSRAWITLARRPLPTNVTALLTGWGSTTITSRMSDQLLQTLMKQVAIPECQAVYKRQLLHTLFCAEAEQSYGPCWGDGGDPLVYEGKLYGLLSWNQGCYEEKVPSVFTDIHKIHPWVLRVIRREGYKG